MKIFKKQNRTNKQIHVLNSPKNREAFCADVLASVLDPSDKVRDKLMDGAFVLHRTGHTLSHLYRVPLTAKQPTSTQKTQSGLMLENSSKLKEQM